MSVIDLSKSLELVERLSRERQDKTYEATSLKVIPSTIDKTKAFVVNGPDGPGVTLVDVPPLPRRIEAGSLDAVAEIAAYYKTSEAGKVARQVVYVGEDVVDLVLDEATRRESARFKLETNPAWNAVVELGDDDAPWLSQREILDLLRVKINGAYQPDNLVATLRSIKFSSGGSGESTVKTGKESIAKSTMVEMSGISGEIPEDVEISSAVYSNVRAGGKLLSATVKMDLATNVAEGKFKLRPKAGEIERCCEEATAAIVNELRRLMPEVPVFAGTIAAG